MSRLPICTASRASVALAALLVTHAVLLMSPLLYAVGFRALLVIPATVGIVLLVAALRERALPLWVVLLVVVSLATSSVAGIYWESWRGALLPALFCASLLAVSITTRSELRRVVSISSALLIVMLIGGWVAVVLAFRGMTALETIGGLHERPLYFYLTTLTPTVIGNFIRPAGIYDEPGALSFVVCVFAFARHTFGMDRRITWTMLTLGFVTFSLAHLAYVAIHLASERRIALAWANFVLVATLGFLALSSSGIWEHFDAQLVARLSVSAESGRVVSGDNRTRNLLRAVDLLDREGYELFLFGADVTCIEGSATCNRKFPGVGFTPLSPLVHYGLLISWPYYLFLLMTIGVGTLGRKWWPLFGIGLLFMQRPFLLDMGYSMLSALVLFFVVYSIQASELFRRPGWRRDDRAVFT